MAAIGIAALLVLAIAAVEKVDAEAVEAVAARSLQPLDPVLVRDRPAARLRVLEIAGARRAGPQQRREQRRRCCRGDKNPPEEQGALRAGRRAHRAADRQTVHAKSRLPDTNRHTLAVLAAGADAIV